MIRRTSIALAAVTMTLAAVPALDRASAQTTSSGNAGGGMDDVAGYNTLSFTDPRPNGIYEMFRAPQPNQSLPGAAPRASDRDMRGAPSMWGRGMMRGGGRMNGGMGGRR